MNFDYPIKVNENDIKSSRNLNALSNPINEFTDNVDNKFNTVEDAIEAYKRGEFVIVMDDENRENEGDLLVPAAGINDNQMAWMIKHTSGYICISLTPDRLIELGIPMMTPENTEKHRTAYTVTVDYLKGVTTGISAHDRALTSRMLCPGSGATSEDFNRPGHMVPLRYTNGGTVNRQGHTEASTDLCILAGLPPAGLLCEIVDPDSLSGQMARLPQCMKFAKRWSIPIITVEMISQKMKELRQ